MHKESFASSTTQDAELVQPIGRPYIRIKKYHATFADDPYEQQ